MIIYIKLGKAYFDVAYFFNVRKANEALLGKHGEAITVQIGRNNIRTFEGKINRTANNTGTPRLMLGSNYKAWVQANFKLGDVMKVEIVSPHKIILYGKGEEH